MSKHPVPVDEAAINAVFDKYITAQPVEGEHIPRDNPDPDAPQYDPQAWEDEAGYIVAGLMDIAVPQWQVPTETQANLAAGIAAAIRKKWPVSVGSTVKEKVKNMGPWGQIAEAAADTLRHGVVMEGWKPHLKPFGPAPETPENEQDINYDIDNNDTPAQVKSVGGKFTTEGE